MLFDFATIGVFLVLAYLFVLAALITSRLIAPHRPYPAKLMTYECGEPPIGPSWVRFNNRFYIIALVFLLFDVEVVFILPCAVIFRPLAGSRAGWFIFAELLVFVLILIAGLAYVWAKGDLNWVKTLRPGLGEPPAEERVELEAPVLTSLQPAAAALAEASGKE
jgi:NADH-quinone oxidoreductase subunit A